MSWDFTLFMLRWLFCWCLVVDGIAGILTCGFFKTHLAMGVAKIMGRYRWELER